MAVTSPTGNIFADAAVLAANSYNDTPDADTTLGWQPLEATDLGLAATGSFNGSTYTFRDGSYVDTDATNSAVAHVYLGELNGQTTLAVAFRGTDEPGDLKDHPHFTDHFAQFQPLMSAIDSYAADPNHGIDKVLLTGHSLGSAMVTTAMVEEGWINDPKYLGVAIASHGTDASVAAMAPAHVDNLVNFIHTQDFLVLARENGLPADTIANLLGTGSLIGDQVDFEPKARVGTDVWIDTGNAARLLQEASNGQFEDPVTAEHRIGRYEADITTLATHGELQPPALLSSNAPHYFAVGTDGNDFLAQDQLFTSDARNADFFPTKDLDQHIYGGSGDDQLAGSGGNDFIDGGPGQDTAYFRGTEAQYSVSAHNGVTTVSDVSPGGRPSDGTDTLVNVETLHFADGELTAAGAPIAGSGTNSPPVTFGNLLHQPSVTLAGVGDEVTHFLDHVF